MPKYIKTLLIYLGTYVELRKSVESAGIIVRSKVIDNDRGNHPKAAKVSPINVLKWFLGTNDWKISNEDEEYRQFIRQDWAAGMLDFFRWVIIIVGRDNGDHQKFKKQL